MESLNQSDVFSEKYFMTDIPFEQLDISTHMSFNFDQPLRIFFT